MERKGLKDSGDWNVRVGLGFKTELPTLGRHGGEGMDLRADPASWGLGPPGSLFSAGQTSQWERQALGSEPECSGVGGSPGGGDR